MARDSTIIHTYGKTGIDISALSEHKTEAEILYPPGSQFRVVFTGEHEGELPSIFDNEPPQKKKISYLVVEEISATAKTGVSGIMDALDLAKPSVKAVQKQPRPAPLSQAQATGPWIGSAPEDDDDDTPPVDIDTFHG
jgi:N-acetylglutamate synthase/N-acetylornithine aminotransferase